MLLFRQQNAGENRETKKASRSVENVEQFTYFGTRATNQSLIQEDIKRLNSVNAYYQ
jgi:hypothetical protein